MSGRTRLRAVAKIAAKQGAIAAYRSLGLENRIKGLGPAFSTKSIAFNPRVCCRRL